MAHKPQSYLLPLLLCFTILFVGTHVTKAARQVPSTIQNSNKKDSEWFSAEDIDVYVPIVGKVTIPTLGGRTSNTPDAGIGGDANNGLGGGVGNIGGNGNGGNAFGGTGDNGNGNGGNAFGGTGDNGAGNGGNAFGGTGDNGNGNGNAFGGTGDNGNGNGGNAFGGTGDNGGAFGGTGDNGDGSNNSGLGGTGSTGGVGNDDNGFDGRHFLPGGDDTFLPNPGVEIPNPINASPAAAQP